MKEKIDYILKVVDLYIWNTKQKIHDFNEGKNR